MTIKLLVLPFVFIANKDVNVNNLSAEQYVNILTGKITNWKEVGGKTKITIIHRQNHQIKSDNQAETVLKGANFTDNAIIQDFLKEL